MRKNTVWMSAILATAFAPGVATEVRAQTDATNYMYGRCYKANPGKSAELREFFNTIGRTLGEEAVKSGKMASYSVIEARVPRGRDVMCDFIATNRYVGYPSDLQLMTDAALKRLKMKEGDVGDKLRAAGYLVQSTLSRVVGAAGGAKEGAVVRVQTFDVSQSSAYEDLVQAEIQALAETRVDAGEMLGWGTAVVLQPGGSNRDFDASSWSLFEDMSAQGKQPNWERHYAKSSPGKSWDDFVRRLLETRETVDAGLFAVRVVVSAE